MQNLLNIFLLAILATTSIAAKKPGCRKSGQKACKGVCVNIMTNPMHCGNCKTKCESTQTCVDGSCAGCLEDEIECPAGSGICVDTDSDPKNCGACGNPCEDGYVCNRGSCRPPCKSQGHYVGSQCYYFNCKSRTDGGVITTTPGSNIDDCAAKCNNQQDCIIVDFNVATKTCTLLDSFSFMESDSGYDTASLDDDGDLCQN